MCAQIHLVCLQLRASWKSGAPQRQGRQLQKVVILALVLLGGLALPGPATFPLSIFIEQLACVSSRPRLGAGCGDGLLRELYSPGARYGPGLGLKEASILCQH